MTTTGRLVAIITKTCYFYNTNHLFCVSSDIKSSKNFCLFTTFFVHNHLPVDRSLFRRGGEAVGQRTAVTFRQIVNLRQIRDLQNRNLLQTRDDRNHDLHQILDHYQTRDGCQRVVGRSLQIRDDCRKAAANPPRIRSSLRGHKGRCSVYPVWMSWIYRGQAGTGKKRLDCLYKHILPTTFNTYFFIST